MAPTQAEVTKLAEIRDELRERHLHPAAERPATNGRGIHHTALISSDVERTIEFYQDLLGFPLTELIENRDYPGSSHFFFDIGNGNLLAFFDFPSPDPRSGVPNCSVRIGRRRARRPEQVTSNGPP
jgi:hypothetical protein